MTHDETTSAQASDPAAPECPECGRPMEPCDDVGTEGYLCDDCEMGASVNHRVLGRPVVVEYFDVEFGPLSA